MKKAVTVVMIDDEQAILKIISTVLRMWGFNVVTASDGDAGWQLIENLQPTLVISDFKMPGKNGLELFRETKTMFPDIGFILLTGEAREDIERLGFEHIVFKPFNLEDLRAKIDEVLASQK